MPTLRDTLERAQALLLEAQDMLGNAENVDTQARSWVKRASTQDWIRRARAFTDPQITKVEFPDKDGAFKIETQHWTVPLLVHAFRSILDHPVPGGAPNCVEIRARDDVKDQDYVVTIRRLHGLSPMQLKEQAEAERDEARADLQVQREARKKAEDQVQMLHAALKHQPFEGDDRSILGWRADGEGVWYGPREVETEVVDLVSVEQGKLRVEGDPPPLGVVRAIVCPGLMTELAEARAAAEQYRAKAWELGNRIPNDGDHTMEREWPLPWETRNGLTAEQVQSMAKRAQAFAREHRDIEVAGGMLVEHEIQQRVVSNIDGILDGIVERQSMYVSSDNAAEELVRILLQLRACALGVQEPPIKAWLAEQYPDQPGTTRSILDHALQWSDHVQEFKKELRRLIEAMRAANAADGRADSPVQPDTELQSVKAERDRWWAVLCEASDALGGPTPEKAPHVPAWIRKDRQRIAELEAALLRVQAVVAATETPQGEAIPLMDLGELTGQVLALGDSHDKLEAFAAAAVGAKEEAKQREADAMEALNSLVDPITGDPFFCLMRADPGQGAPQGWVATFGGPFDSYTLCQRDDDGTFMRFRFDHDMGAAREWETFSVYLLAEDDLTDEQFEVLEKVLERT